MTRSFSTKLPVQVQTERLVKTILTRHGVMPGLNHFYMQFAKKIVKLQEKYDSDTFINEACAEAAHWFNRGLDPFILHLILELYMAKICAPFDAYYVLTQAHVDLVNSKLHPNTGAPLYDVTHLLSDLTIDQILSMGAFAIHVGDLEISGTEIYNPDESDRGKITLAGDRTGDVKENMWFKWNNGWVTIGSDTGISSAEWYMDFKLTDQRRVGFGTNNDAAIVWDVQGAQDYWRFSIDVGSSGKSGAMILCNDSLWYGRDMPQQWFANPTFGIHSGLANTEQTMYMGYTGTEFKIWTVSGKGNLHLESGSGSVVSESYLDVIQAAGSWITVDSTTTFNKAMAMTVSDPSSVIVFDSGSHLVFRSQATASIRAHTLAGSSQRAILTNAGHFTATDLTAYNDVTGNDIIIRNNIVFIGGDNEGLANGCMYVIGNAVATAFAFAGIKVQYTRFDTDGLSSRMTPDHTRDHIEADVDGTFLVICSITADSVAGIGAAFDFQLYKNNGTVILTNLHAHRDFAGGAGEIGSISLSGTVVLLSGDTVELWVTNDSNTQSIVITDVTMSIVQIASQTIAP